MTVGWQWSGVGKGGGMRRGGVWWGAVGMEWVGLAGVSLVRSGWIGLGLNRAGWWLVRLGGAGLGYSGCYVQPIGFSASRNP